jgi:MSHA type pilus biogenesis protein MshL
MSMSIELLAKSWARSAIPIVISCTAALALIACASGGAARQVHTGVRVEPTGPVAPTTQATPTADQPVATFDLVAPSLPQLPGVRQAALSPGREQRVSSLIVAAGTPIATAVAQLGAKLGWTVSVDPDVRGTARTTSLRDVTVGEALNELVSRNGYAYQLQGTQQGTVLRVVPIRMESRTFRLDYVALSRVGTMSTIVQRRLNGGGGNSQQTGGLGGQSSAASGVGALGGAGGDVLSAQSVADIWQEIRIALTGIIQAGQPQTAASSLANQTNPAAGSGGSFGSGASSVPFPDGSNLVISPISGLINVTAMPDKLADVERFINDFQASVLRQVLIEAKIVEVNLSSTFQFGIDWAVVANASSGKYGIALKSDPSVQTTGNAGNVNFTITGGNAQVNAVLTALSSQGNVSVLSNEKTSALNNQRAIFQVTTDEIFFSVTQTPLFGVNGGVISTQSSIIPQQISVGVVLDVLAQISAENMITMDIRPAVTNIDHVETITLSDGTSSSAPAIAKREGDTIARLRAGETMIIGGLVQTRKDRTVSGIPILMDLPWLGKAFQKVKITENRSELVVFLTPTIISGQPVSTGR